MKYKTGLIPMPRPPRLRFGFYADDAVLLPQVPDVFGHYNLYPARGWGMLGNDHLGDCTVAGAMHVVMLWRAAIGNPVIFTALDATEDYFSITGGSDSGVNMMQQGKYWQDVGFRDSTGQRHKILAYMHVDPTNLAHVDAACYLFDAVGWGVSVGPYEEQAFERGQPWAYPTYTIAGYHYVPMVGKDPQYRKIITWGGLQDVSEAWFKGRVGEVVAILTDENLQSGKTLEGFNLDDLKADLLRLR